MQAKEKTKLGLYVHVPFCASTCDFCAFYQKKPVKIQIEQYLEGIEQELKLIKNPLFFDTIFFGGGTPGLLSAEHLERLCRAILEKTVRPPIEWTIEMAPSVVKKDKLLLLKELGVNRISMGVQSFNSSLLSALGRLHNPSQVYKAYDLIKNAGFQNINLDLIFSIPGQTLKESEADIREAMRLEPTHISTYCLTFEEDTALYLKLSKGLIKRNESLETEFYTQAWDILESASYTQYEVSNFAKKGYPCLHNIHTWQMQEWIGIGPSAASQFQMERYTNPSTQKWLEGLSLGKASRIDYTALDDTILGIDACVFGLRMNKGIDLDALKQRFTLDWMKLEPVWEKLIKNKLLEKNGVFLSLTTSGRLLADSVGSLILETMQ